jgi:hypothetical protein
MSNMKRALENLEEELDFLRYIYEHMDSDVALVYRDSWVELGNVVPEGY